MASLSAQLSGLGGMGQSPASGSWKSGSLDVVGRQRSSSDPPNMHPPVPPIRLISSAGTGAALPSPSSLSERFLLDFETDKQVFGINVCVPGLGPATGAKMEALNTQSKSGQGGSRAVPPKSPAG